MSVGSRERRKAAKDHVCDECRRTIPKGAVYVWSSNLFDGSWSTWKKRLRCDRAWTRAHDRGALVDIDWEIGEGPDVGGLAGFLREWRNDWRWARAFRHLSPSTTLEVVRLRRERRRTREAQRAHLVRP